MAELPIERKARQSWVSWLFAILALALLAANWFSRPRGTDPSTTREDATAARTTASAARGSAVVPFVQLHRTTKEMDGQHADAAEDVRRRALIPATFD